MSSADLDALVAREYQHGFVTDIESDTLPPGLDEQVVRAISLRKREPEFMLEFRLKAYRYEVTPGQQRAQHVLARDLARRAHQSRGRDARGAEDAEAERCVRQASGMVRPARARNK